MDQTAEEKQLRSTVMCILNGVSRFKVANLLYGIVSVVREIVVKLLVWSGSRL